MKMNLLLLLSLVAFPLAAAAPPVWTVNQPATKLEFSVPHMMVANVTGSFRRVTGSVTGDPSDPLSAHIEIAIDPASIDTGLEDRDTHLRTGEFFDVAHYPTAAYVSRKIVRGADGKLTILGLLTLRGVTREVPLTVQSISPAVSDAHTMHVLVRAIGSLSRKDFGIVWNKALEGGGVLVGDEVTLDITLAVDRPRQGSAAPVVPARPQAHGQH